MPKNEDLNLYDYSLKSPKQKAIEADLLAKAKQEANTQSLKDFFKSKAIKA